MKYFLAAALGSLAAAAILFVVAGIFLGVLASMTSPKIELNKNSILVMELTGAIPERTTNDPIQQLFAGITGQQLVPGLNQILASIEKAARDERIMGIYLEPGMVSAGWATVGEIRNALERFRESGKFVYSFGAIYTQQGYYLASVADSVFLNPAGMLYFQGLSSTYTFFKGTLEKLGVEMQVFQQGEFKSAVEPFMLDRMSEAARLQSEVYLNSMWQHVLSRVAASRDLSVEALNQVAEGLPAFMPDSLLLTSGLIDGLKYKDEVIEALKERVGIEPEKDLNSISLAKYTQVYVPDSTPGLERDKIAVIYAEGEIDGSSTGGIQSDELSRTIRQARRDTTIKAIVLRVNSPGGSGLGSEIIWREVKLASETKPMVVSMGNLAASGGYYIASAADTILANPTTLTGSIGVFGLIPNTKGLLGKMGITTDRVKTNTFADMPALDRPFTPDEKKILQAYIERFYHFFLQRCAAGRETTVEAINKVGEGRVWTGANALELNLVDKLGGIDEAIKIAAEMAGLETYRIVELPELLTPMEQLMKSFSGDVSASIRRILFGEKHELLETVSNLQHGYPIQARLPFNISIN